MTHTFFLPRAKNDEDGKDRIFAIFLEKPPECSLRSRDTAGLECASAFSRPFLAANSSCCSTAKFIPRMLVWSLFCQQSQILTLTSPVDINVLTRSALVLTTKDSLFHSFQIRITKIMFVNSLLYRQLRRLPEILILDWFSSLEFTFKSVPFFNSMARIPVIVPFLWCFFPQIYLKN